MAAPDPTGRAAIRWPPRVTRGRLRQLYLSVASENLDEQLLDDIGISLYMRCRAILTISEAKRGRVLCPVCDRAGRETWITRAGRARAEVIRCGECGWEICWADYLRTFMRRQFNEGGAGKAFRRFVETYPRCRTPWEKMLAVDMVIHEFHYSLREDPTRPTRAVCVNLVEGKLGEVVALLNEIATSPDLREDMAASHATWKAKCGMAGEWHPK